MQRKPRQSTYRCINFAHGIFLVLVSFLFADKAAANPVAGNGRPSASAILDSGAAVLVGARKLVWLESTAGNSVGTAAFAWNNAAFEPSVRATREGALACTPSTIVRWENGARKWSEVAGARALIGAKQPGADACAVARNAVAYTSGARLFLVAVDAAGTSDLGFVTLPAGFGGAGSPLRIVGNSSPNAGVVDFAVLNGKGAAITLRRKDNSVEIISLARDGRFPAATRNTALALRDETLLRAGDEGVFVSRLDGGTLRARSAAVSPCAENETCGVSLAPDSTWLVCGSWGCYLGETAGDTKRRVPLPVLAEEGGATSLAHGGADGHYVYLGASDSDFGTLPGLTGFRGAREARAGLATRWRAVWTHPAFATAEEALARAREVTRTQVSDVSEMRVLFPYAIERTRGVLSWGAVLAMPAAAGVAVVPGSHDTTESESLPSFAVAMENAAAFDAPEWRTNPSGLPAGQPPGLRAETVKAVGTWWRDSLKLDETLSRLNAANVVLEDVTVGVIDSGIDLSHEAFERTLATERYDFVEEDETPQDAFGHGTHVAALVSSFREGKPFGVAPNARLVVARALDAAGRSDSITLARALAFTRASGARIINCSWGGGPETQILRDAFADLARASVFIASSAGNDALDLDKNPIVPKSFPGVVNTGAFNEKGARANFSNTGKNSVLLFAPGDDILSALPGGIFALKSGTSMASPLTAGTAALLLGAGARIDSLASRLCTSATPDELSRVSRCGSLSPLAATSALLSETP